MSAHSEQYIKARLNESSLDLTAALKAYIMDPQWNHMVEELALDHIHHFVQTKHVTTVRYIIKDTWEEGSGCSSSLWNGTAEHM